MSLANSFASNHLAADPTEDNAPKAASDVGPAADINHADLTKAARYALGGDAVAALGGDAVAALGGYAVAALGDDAVAALGGDAVAALGDDAVAALGDDAVAALGGDAVAALGNDAVAALGNDAVAALGDDAVAALGDDAVAALGGDAFADALCMAAGVQSRLNKLANPSNTSIANASKALSACCQRMQGAEWQKRTVLMRTLANSLKSCDSAVVGDTPHNVLEELHRVSYVFAAAVHLVRVCMRLGNCKHEDVAASMRNLDKQIRRRMHAVHTRVHSDTHGNNNCATSLHTFDIVRQCRGVLCKAAAVFEVLSLPI